MDIIESDKIKNKVRSSYARVAVKGIPIKKSSCCCSANKGELKAPSLTIELQKDAEEISRKIGYSEEELNSVPVGANMGLGCGNPQVFASINEGETVVDLGSGAGFDSFLAARKVGEQGKVIGVDMTPEMITKSRNLAFKNNYINVEFRLGEIEHLPIEDNSIDVIISNCVINLSPKKLQVYKEAFRVLKNGGRIAISDVIAVKELTEEMKNDDKLLCGCVTGALNESTIKNILSDAGFSEIEVTLKQVPKEYEEKWGHNLKLGQYVMSGMIKARKIL